MQRIDYPSKEERKILLSRPVIDNKLLSKQVGKILTDIKNGGDRALRSYTKKFDGVVIKKTLVGQKEINQSDNLISENLKAAISHAAENIRLFHSTQLEPIPKVETTPGVFCWRKSIAIERVGLYIPGGTAALC